MPSSNGRRRGDPNVARYYNDVSKMEILDANTERELFFRYKRRGDIHARDKIVGSALRFVVKLARKYARDEEVTKDLVSAGNVGLMRALDRYEPERGTRFLSYATSWVLLEMRNELYNADLVSQPLWRQKAIHQVQQVDARNEAHSGVRASVEELSKKMDLSPTQLNRLNGRSRVKIVSLYEPRHGRSLSNETSTTMMLINALRDPTIEIDAQAMDSERRKILQERISKLPTVAEQFVIKAYFGWMSDPLSLRQIGNVLLVTSERVRQIKVRALRRLKKQLRLLKRIDSVGCLQAD